MLGCGGLLYTVADLAASLASTHSMPTAPTTLRIIALDVINNLQKIQRTKKHAEHHHRNTTSKNEDCRKLQNKHCVAEKKTFKEAMLENLIKNLKGTAINCKIQILFGF